MSPENLLARITIDPAICHGAPCIRGLRYPVPFLLELLGSGTKEDEAVADYPDLEKEDFRAAYLYASRLIRTKQIGHDTA